MFTKRRDSKISLVALMDLAQWRIGVSVFTLEGCRKFRGNKWKERVEQVFIDLEILCFTLRFTIAVKGKWRNWE